MRTGGGEVVDLRKIPGSPLEVSLDTTPAQLRKAMAERHNMIAAIFDIATSKVRGAAITDELINQAVAAAELLNQEVDTMEKILVEH